MRSLEIPTDYALVLQQVEDGEEDFTNLAESLSLDKRRLAHIIQALRHKGLVIVQWRNAGSESWISLSSHGKRLVRTLWGTPATKLQPGF